MAQSEVDARSEPFSLKGGHIVVIGASRGIGAAVARAVSAAGARVTVTARLVDDLRETVTTIERSGGRVSPVPCEVTDSQSVDAIMESADSWAPVTGVVVCAGVSARYDIGDMPDAEYRRVVETNLTGSWNCARAAGRAMGSRGSGSLVLFGSLTSSFGMNLASAYAATKGAVVQLGKSLAVEWAEQGIRVNIVAPGFVETEMTKVSLGIPLRRQWILSRTPLRRFAEPREVAEAVVFLSSSAASFVTGQVLYVDGGFTAGSQW